MDKKQVVVLLDHNQPPAPATYDHSSPTSSITTITIRVIVDHKLNWIDHITYVKNIIYTRMRITDEAKRYLNNITLKKIIMLIFIFISHIVLKYGDLLLKVI